MADLEISNILKNPEVIRLIVGFVVSIFFYFIRSIRTRRLESNDFVEIAFAIGGIFLIGSLFIKALTNQQVLDLIGLDGLLALFVGTGTQIISSLNTELRQDCIYIYNFIFFLQLNFYGQK